jgi:outer membrane protein assembly factor BamD
VGLAGLAIAAAAVGCGGGARLPEPVVPLDSVLARARIDYREGRCKQAQPAFSRAVGELPSRDPRVAEATYFLGECDFAGGLYLEASRQFRRVADTYAAHPLAPDALLRSGDALAELWKQPALDPTYGESAIAVYRELLARFPDSPAAARAGIKLAALEDRFAEKDYLNGVFYFRLRAYDSAIIYFRSVVANYAQSRFAPRALIRLVEAYRTIGYAEEARETCEHLRRYYPETEGLVTACPSPVGTP